MSPGLSNFATKFFFYTFFIRLGNSLSKTDRIFLANTISTDERPESVFEFRVFCKQQKTFVYSSHQCPCLDSFLELF